MFPSGDSDTSYFRQVETPDGTWEIKYPKMVYPIAGSTAHLKEIARPHAGDLALGKVGESESGSMGRAMSSLASLWTNQIMEYRGFYQYLLCRVMTSLFNTSPNSRLLEENLEIRKSFRVTLFLVDVSNETGFVRWKHLTSLER